MSLREKVQLDMQEALRQNDELRVLVLRMLIAAFNNAEIEKRTRQIKAGEEPEPLTEEEFVTIVEREYKQRKESADEYQKANRPDLKAREEQEAEILSVYLPQRIPDEELRIIIKKEIAAQGVTNELGLGKLMASLSSQLRGKADLGEVSRMARELLRSND